MLEKFENALADAARTGVFDIRTEDSPTVDDLIANGAFAREDLTSIPGQIRDLRNIEELHLDNWNITNVPSWIGELRSLRVLDLGENPLGPLPHEFGRLENLRALGLSRTRRGVVDDVLCHLGALEVLTLSDNALESMPPWIGDLPQLKLLSIGGNPLTSLPDTFGQLQRLTHLLMWGHHLTALPEPLRLISSLEVLDMSNEGGTAIGPGTPVQWGAVDTPLYDVTGISMMPARGIRYLPGWLADAYPRLRVLQLSGQALRALSNLPDSLEEVYLSGNLIEIFPPTVLECPRIRVLELSHNKLRDLPSDLARMQNLEYLNLMGNELSLPPEVLAEPLRPSAILEFTSRGLGPTRPLDEAKLVVVGEGHVGKTSLVRRLVSNDYSDTEPKTKGIDVTAWRVDAPKGSIKLNIWDFGGQEIMHATHQFFLTKRSLYLLVVDARQDEDQNRIEYWLKLIQSFSDRSPVIVVGNKIDEAFFDVDIRGLKGKYPDIVDIQSVSCKTGIGLADLNNLLAEVLDELPHVRDLLPAAFFEVKAELEKFDANYLPYAEYTKLCNHHDIQTESAQEALVGFLHDLGTVVCFRDDPRLADTNILNPEWVTGGVYRILNAHIAAQKRGLLTWDDISCILDTDDYPPERRAFIIDIMKRFELCFESDNTFLVPDLLTKEEPDTGSWRDALLFEVGYHILPSSIVSRLIVRMHAAISKHTVWRTGVVLAMDSNRAIVRADREDGVIRIAVSGPQATRRGLLTAVRGELRAIESTIPGLVGEERVPVAGYPGVWVPYRHLLELEATGRETVVPQGLTVDLDIRELLAGVEVGTDRAGAVEVGLAPPATPAGDGREVDHLAPREARPWTPPEAIRLGMTLLVAVVVLVAVFAVADLVVGTPAVAGLVTSAVGGAALIGMFVLRSSGRASEAGLLEALRHAIGRGRSA